MLLYWSHRIWILWFATWAQWIHRCTPTWPSLCSVLVSSSWPGSLCILLYEWAGGVVVCLVCVVSLGRFCTLFTHTATLHTHTHPTHTHTLPPPTHTTDCFFLNPLSLDMKWLVPSSPATSLRSSSSLCGLHCSWALVAPSYCSGLEYSSDNQLILVDTIHANWLTS